MVVVTAHIAREPPIVFCMPCLYSCSSVACAASVKPRGLPVSAFTATPSFPCRLYVPDWNSNLWCLDAVTGAVVWQKKISDLVYTVDPAPYPKAANTTIISRTSPAIAGNLLVRILGS